MFDSNYQVFNQSFLKLALNFNSFSNTATASTSSSMYFFRSVGFSHPQTLIHNNKNEVIGTIHYNLLSFNAQLVMQSGEKFNWSFQNNWMSAWSLNNQKDKQVLYHAKSGKGRIDASVDDELIVGCGIFIREYYVRILFILFLVLFIPIMGKGLI